MSQYLSKWRSFIMGFSILWIILYHAPFQVSISFITSFINRGYIGVEMFLLVSGYGLYYSIANRRIIDFYKRRFIRVYPEFLIVVVLAFLLSGLSSSLDCVLWKLSTIGFWIVNKPFYCWYISLIFILYVLFPLFSKLLEMNFSLFFIIIIIICILLSVCMFPFYNVVRLMDLFSHIPIFLTGAALGYISCHEKFKKNSFSIKKFNM